MAVFSGVLAALTWPLFRDSHPSMEGFGYFMMALAAFAAGVAAAPFFTTLPWNRPLKAEGKVRRVVITVLPGTGDVIGMGQRGAAFSYSLYSSLGNASLIYVTWPDGIGFGCVGARGLMRTDALAGGIAAVILFVLVPRFVKTPATASKPAEMAAPA